jgi:hypothetical protein
MAIKISMLPYTFFIYSLSLLNKIPLPCCLPFSKLPQTNILFGHNKIYLFQIFSQIYINPNNRTHQPIKIYLIHAFHCLFINLYIYYYSKILINLSHVEHNTIYLFNLYKFYYLDNVFLDWMFNLN